MFTLGTWWAGGGVAAGGGSWLDFEQAAYRPGEEARAEGWVSHGQLGWVEDGPFFAYLRPPGTVPEASAPDQWPWISPRDLPLAPLDIGPPPTGYAGVTARLIFPVPEVAPGTYEVVYCNDPCTDGLGDLIGATLAVADADGAVPTTSTTVPERTTLAPSAAPPSTSPEPGPRSSSGSPALGLLGIVPLGALAVVLLRRVARP